MDNKMDNKAAIHSGNSGNALANSDGELLGVNEAIKAPVESSIGIGFAIPNQCRTQGGPALTSAIVVARIASGTFAAILVGQVKAALKKRGHSAHLCRPIICTRTLTQADHLHA